MKTRKSKTTGTFTNNVFINNKQTNLVRIYMKKGYVVEGSGHKNVVKMKHPKSGDSFHISEDGITFKTSEEWEKHTR